MYFFENLDLSLEEQIGVENRILSVVGICFLKTCMYFFLSCTDHPSGKDQWGFVSKCVMPMGGVMYFFHPPAFKKPPYSL